MADLVTIAVTAALTQFVGPGAKHLGEQALERAKQVASKAAGLLGAVGREPQPVEPKLLLPLVQAASLETDETLAERWVALLANAADPEQRVKVQPGFAQILHQLTPGDANLLSAVAVSSQGYVPIHRRVAFFTSVHTYQNELPSTDFEVSVDNLVRLGLCVTRDHATPSDLSELLRGMPNQVGPGRNTIAITYLGLALLAAVTPPTS